MTPQHPDDPAGPQPAPGARHTGQDLGLAEASSGDVRPTGQDLGLSEVTSSDVVDVVGVVDLAAEGERLLAQARERGRGRAVRAVVRQPGQQAILLALPAGGGLPAHDAPGPASLHCLTGAVRLGAGERSWELTPGSIVVIPQVTHDVVAHEDSTCLLVVTTG